MAEPKKKLSKTRTHLRRSNIKVDLVPKSVCSHCKEVIRAHQVCNKCGYYKGKLVLKKVPTAPKADAQQQDKTDST